MFDKHSLETNFIILQGKILRSVLFQRSTSFLYPSSVKNWCLFEIGHFKGDFQLLEISVIRSKFLFPVEVQITGSLLSLFVYNL